MILSCNSCEKKFVVPDQAITAAGRLVQCGSCGNKWKQFPLNKQANIVANNKKTKNKIVKISKTPKIKKKRIKKEREVNLYSPEYLEKKHGISLKNIEETKNASSTKKVSFGFYSTLILFTVLIIILSRSLYFFQDFIVKTMPFTEFYLNYFFESARNIFEIVKSLIYSY
jgi:predicted Zn finger-like uncharacterized protein